MTTGYNEESEDMMAEEDIDRIYKALADIQKELGEFQVNFAVHCAQNKPPAGWKTYMIFMVAGALLSHGPKGIELLAKFVGIG